MKRFVEDVLLSFSSMCIALITIVLYYHTQSVCVGRACILTYVWPW
jgi:hypothetical protein